MKKNYIFDQYEIIETDNFIITESLDESSALIIYYFYKKDLGIDSNYIGSLTLNQTGEISYIVNNEENRNKGYTTEVLRSLRNHILKNENKNPFLRIDMSNLASQKVASKSGFVKTIPGEESYRQIEFWEIREVLNTDRLKIVKDLKSNFTAYTYYLQEDLLYETSIGKIIHTDSGEFCYYLNEALDINKKDCRYSRKGYTSEAFENIVLNLSSEQLELSMLKITDKNIASQKIAKKAGYELTHRGIYNNIWKQKKQ